MPRQFEQGLDRVHVLLYSEDVEKIKQLYGRSIGFSAAIRNMVHSTLATLETRAAAKSRPVHVDVGESLPSTSNEE